MADLIWLTANEQPPADTDCVFVQPTPSGWYTINGHASQWRKAAIFYTPLPEPDQASAIIRAEAWADEHGVPAVYVSTP